MPIPTSYISAPEDDEEGSAGWALPDMQPPAAPAWNELSPNPAPVAAPPPAADSYSAPVYTPPDRSNLDASWAKMQADQKPLNRQDPALKPKWWERLGGGFGAGLIAAGGGGADTAIRAGESVTNRRYDRAEADRQRQLQADQSGVSAAQAAIQGKEQDYQRQLQQYNAQGIGDQRRAHAAEFDAQEQARRAAVAPGTEQPVDPKNPMGPWTARTVGGQPLQLSSPPDSWLKTPQGKMQAQTAERKTLAESIGAKPGSDDYKYIMANGKLKEPGNTTNVRIPSAELQTYSDWKSAFVRDNKRQPTATEIIAYKRGGGSGGGATAKQVSDLVLKRNVDYQKVNNDFGEQFKAAKTKDEQDALTAEHSAALQELNQKYDDAFSALDPTGTRLGDTQSSDARPQAPAAPPPGAAVQPPAANTVSPSFGGNLAPGMVAPGNINLGNRPNIKNPDGSHSSVFSMGFNVDGKEVLVPGVGDGKTYPLRKLTTAEALDQYKKTGNNLGTFNSPQASDAYAKSLHEDQARGNKPAAAAPIQPPPAAAVTLPPQVASRLKPGVETTFANGQVWTLSNGKPSRVR